MCSKEYSSSRANRRPYVGTLGIVHDRSRVLCVFQRDWSPLPTYALAALPLVQSLHYAYLETQARITEK
jgi:hypothetical protein